MWIVFAVGKVESVGNENNRLDGWILRDPPAPDDGSSLLVRVARACWCAPPVAPMTPKGPHGPPTRQLRRRVSWKDECGIRVRFVRPGPLGLRWGAADDSATQEADFVGLCIAEVSHGSQAAAYPQLKPGLVL